jgi:hypothetical protein
LCSDADVIVVLTVASVAAAAFAAGLSAGLGWWLARKVTGQR